MSLLSVFNRIRATDIARSAGMDDDGSVEYSFIQDIKNIESLYPESRGIIEELCIAAGVDRWDLLSKADNRQTIALRTEIARRLKADVRLSNLQIGILINRSQGEISGLLKGAK